VASLANTLEMPRNAAQHVFLSTPGDGWSNGARQQHIPATTALFLLLRRIRPDNHVASSGIRLQRSRALRIEHSPFAANFGFSHEEPPDMFSMRPSISVSQDDTKRLKLLHDLRAMVRSVLEMHKDEMQGRS
jgi:hypothetical protein